MPPGRVIFFDGSGQAQRPFLNQIKQVQTLALVALGKIDNKPQV